MPLFEILAGCSNMANISPSILTKREQSHSARNKHPNLSLLPQFRQSEPRTSTMQVKCLLCLPKRSAVPISPAITIPASENTGSHYRTKASLIDWLTDMNFQRPKGRGRNQKNARTRLCACADVQRVQSDGDPQRTRCGKRAFIEHHALRHGWFVVLELKKPLTLVSKRETDGQ